MKKCLNCDKEYEEDTSFCPECGTKLKSTNQCPYCGKTIGERDSFCKYCGKKIDREVYCQNCGKEVGEGSKFCPECGTKIESVGFIKAPKETKKKEDAADKNKNGNYPDWLKIVFASISFVLAILLVVGFFGDIYVAKLNGATIADGGAMSIKIFFGDWVEFLKDAFSMPYKEYFALNLVMFIFANLAYFGGIIASLIFVIRGIVENTKALINKTAISLKYQLSAAISSLPYVAIMGVMGIAKASSMTETMEIAFGWGTTMLIVASIISLCLYFGEKITSAAFSKEGIIKKTIWALISILALLVCVFGFNLVGTLREPAYNTVIQESSYMLGFDVLMDFSSGSITKLPSYFGNYYGCLVFALLGALMSIVTVIATTKEKKALTIVFSAMSFAYALVAGILAVLYLKEAYKGSEYGFGLGGSIIMTIVMSSFIIGGVIAQSVLEKKEIKI